MLKTLLLFYDNSNLKRPFYKREFPTDLHIILLVFVATDIQALFMSMPTWPCVPKHALKLREFVIDLCLF